VAFGVGDAAQQIVGAVGVVGGLPFLGDAGCRHSFLIIGKAFFAAVGMNDAGYIFAGIIGGEAVVVAGGVTRGVGYLMQTSPAVQLEGGAVAQRVQNRGRTPLIGVLQALVRTIRGNLTEQLSAFVIAEMSGCAVRSGGGTEVALIIVLP